ncbi:MAG: fatty acid desaturase, partial [Rhodobacterales bacterium]
MELRKALRAYTKKDNRLAYLSLLPNLAVYFLSMGVAIHAAGQGNWALALFAAVVLAFAGVRLYVLQHDLGHLSLFETRRQNTFWGYAVSPFTFASYPQMTYNHNLHHAYVGDLNERHTTEIFTMTRAEW